MKHLYRASIAVSLAALVFAPLPGVASNASQATPSVRAEKLRPVKSVRNSDGLWVATVRLPGGGVSRAVSINPNVVTVTVTTRTDATGHKSMSVSSEAASAVTPRSKKQTAAYLARTTEREFVRDHLVASGERSARIREVVSHYSGTALADGSNRRSAVGPDAEDGDPTGLGCNGRPVSDSLTLVLDAANWFQHSGFIACFDGGGGGHLYYAEKLNTNFYGKNHKPKHSSTWVSRGDRGGLNYPDWSPANPKETDGESCLTFNLGLNPTPYAGLTYSTREQECDGDHRYATNGFWWFGSTWTVNKKWAGTALCSHPWQNYNYKSLALLHIWPNTYYYPRSLHATIAIDL